MHMLMMLNLICKILVSGRIKIIQLSTHPDWSCGGYKLRIQIFQSGKNCLTEEIKEFSRGKTLKWSIEEKNLGDCQNVDIDFNEEITFKMKTSSTNDFCPENLHIELKYGITFISEKMVHWHDVYDNEQSHIVDFCGDC